MTSLEQNPTPLKMSLAVRGKVYLISFLCFLLGGSIGFIADTFVSSKPALTILGVVISLPINFFLLYHFVRQPHDAGNDNKSR